MLIKPFIYCKWGCGGEKSPKPKNQAAVIPTESSCTADNICEHLEGTPSCHWGALASCFVGCPALIALAALNSSCYKFIWWGWSSKQESAFKTRALAAKAEELCLAKQTLSTFCSMPCPWRRSSVHSTLPAVGLPQSQRHTLTSAGCQNPASCTMSPPSWGRRCVLPTQPELLTCFRVSCPTTSHLLQQEQMKWCEKSVQARDVSNIQWHGLL